MKGFLADFKEYISIDINSVNLIIYEGLDFDFELIFDPNYIVELDCELPSKKSKKSKIPCKFILFISEFIMRPCIEE